jgi:hypothetical protein
MLTHKTDKILDEAIKRMQKGENVSAIVSTYPEEMRESLYNLLSIAKQACDLPKAVYPSPIKRRLYLDVPQQSISIFRFFYFVRRAYPVALVLLIATVTGTTTAAMQSLPGDKLFPVKKAFQSAEIKLAQTPERKATLELNLAETRLEEVQSVIARSDNAEVQVEALKELSKQTEVALEKIKSIAASEVVANNPGLVTKAEEITEKQKKLIAIANPEAIEVANEKAIAHDNTIASIKQIIATAQEAVAVSLVPANKISITSTIDGIRSKSVLVEKNTFEISEEETVIHDEKGKKITLSDLNLKDTVSIEGEIKGKSTVAKKITLISRAPIVEKPTTTTILAKPVTKPAAIIEPTVATEPTVIEPTETIEEKPQDTFTGFIPEAPKN